MRFHPDFLGVASWFSAGWEHDHDMEVSSKRGTPKSSIYRLIFQYKPSSYWDATMYGKPTNGCDDGTVRTDVFPTSAAIQKKKNQRKSNHLPLPSWGFRPGGFVAFEGTSHCEREREFLGIPSSTTLRIIFLLLFHSQLKYM